MNANGKKGMRIRKNLKRKILDDEIKAVRQKRRLLQAEIQDLSQEADVLAIKAERKSGMKYLSQSNKKKAVT